MRCRLFRLTRTVARSECPWLPSDLPEGATVFEFLGPTYDCVDSSTGEAISFKDGEGPFFEVPRDALEVAE